MDAPPERKERMLYLVVAACGSGEDGAKWTAMNQGGGRMKQPTLAIRGVVGSWWASSTDD